MREIKRLTALALACLLVFTVSCGNVFAASMQEHQEETEGLESSMEYDADTAVPEDSTEEQSDAESAEALLDTRKTTPNMRIFEKYAVRVGGGYNHRYNLSDGVLLKDNHIGAAGSVTKAVRMAKEYAPFVRKIEVEVENLDMVKEAVEAGADIIMLDNMSAEEMREAIRIIDGRAETECSGNVTKENIGRLTALGVDYISSGALTHSAPILDISLKNLHAVS